MSDPQTTNRPRFIETVVRLYCAGLIYCGIACLGWAFKLTTPPLDAKWLIIGLLSFVGGVLGWRALDEN